MAEIAILGAGAWGQALAIHAVRLGHTITLVARRPEAVAPIDGVCVAGEAPSGAMLIVAVPMQALRGALQGVPRPPALLLGCKGIELGTGALALEVAGAVWPGVAACVLTGPNFAHEIAAGRPAASVVAGVEAHARQAWVGLLGRGALRLYGQDDVVGCQLGGAAKNVVAIAAGAVTGAGLGENARAALITRGLAEIGRLVAAEGGRAETVAGLSGLGDLVLTCTGPASRNFAYGLALGRGAALPGGTVEGVATAPALLARAGGVELPICGVVAAVLAGRLTVGEGVGALMARPVRDE